MPAQARISIMSLCQNNCNYEAVTTALRQSIGEQVRQVADFGVIAEDDHGESELEELTGNDTGCDVHDNWWDEDPLEEIDEFAQQVRSFAEFWDMVRRMRVARLLPDFTVTFVRAESVERQRAGRRTANSLFVKAKARTVGTKTPAGDRGFRKTARSHRNVTKEAKVVEHLCEGNTTIRWTLARRSRQNGFVEVQKDHLVEYDFHIVVSCAEPSSERHTAHVHAPKVRGRSEH